MIGGEIMGLVYKITNIKNGKVYIGQTINSVEHRFNQHWRETKSEHRLGKTTSYFHNAFHKYGVESFEISILEEVDNAQLSEREIYWIAKYNSTDRKIGYNIGSGGETAVTTPEVRAKIGANTKQRWLDPQAAEVMRAGLEKATKEWQRLSAEKRILKSCLSCSKEFSVAEWEKDRKYCSVDCSNKDRKNWMNYEVGLEAASKKNKEIYNARAEDIKEIVLDWTILNKDFVLKIPYNRITPNLQPMIDLVETNIGVSDARTIAKAVSGQSSRKGLLDYLKNYVKMYAVPDQK